MTRKILIALLASVLLILAGCKQDMDNTKLAPSLYDYIPKDVGHSVIYDVDSISYYYLQGGTQIIDTVHYQLKEVIMDSADAICQNGLICYGVNEFKRYDTTQPFSTYPTLWWYFYTTPNSYIIDKYDLTFVKFTFPPLNGNTWLGNEYLPANDTIADTYQTYALVPWVYTFSNVNAPSTINGHFFDSTAVVTEVNTEPQNAITGIVSICTYARHVGLVYSQWEVLNKQDPTSSWANPNQTNGFRIFTWYHGYTP